MTSTFKKITMAAAFLAAAVWSPLQASAHVRGGISIGIGGRAVYAPSHYVSGYYTTRAVQVLISPGHYETRVETVLVEAGHWETRCIPAIERTVYDGHGRARRIIEQAARTERFWVPDRFETQTVRVWVAPVYTTRMVQEYVPGYWTGGGGYSSGPVWGIRGGFRW